MDQSLIVGVMKRLGHRGHEFRRSPDGHTLPLDPFRQTLPVDELRHHVKRDLVVTPDIVDGDDVRVIEVGDGSGLLQVKPRVFRTRDQPGVGNLDRDGPLNCSS